MVWQRELGSSMTALAAHLDCSGVNIKLVEDGKRLLIQCIADGNACDIWGIAIVQAADVFHDPNMVCLDGSQDQ